MDIDLLKTFLEVNRTRHFGRAAENLYLTQSAVSARIRQLEEILGVDLFMRTRNNIQLTSAGQRLLKSAESILNAWNRARQDTALAEDRRRSLAIGGVFSLWDILLQRWLHALYRGLPDVAFQAEAHSQEVLVRKLMDGALDIGFMFEPPQIAELLTTEASAIKLAMVSSRPGLNAEQAIRDNYILVDWGMAFASSHARRFPDIPPPAVRFGLGRMALAFILDCGGSAYLPEQMVGGHIKNGSLHRVADAPVIDRSAFAVYPSGSAQRGLVEKALGYMRNRETFNLVEQA